MLCNNVLHLPRKFGSHVSNRSSDIGWSDSAVPQWPQKDCGKGYSQRAPLYREPCSHSTCRREIGKIVRCLPDKKKQNFASLCRSRYCANRGQNLPGPAQTVYSECCRFHPNRFTFGGVISERVNTVRAHWKVKPSFAPNNKQRIVLFCAVVIGCFMSRDYN